MFTSILILFFFAILATGGVMNQLSVAGKTFGGKRKEFGTFFLFLILNSCLVFPFIMSVVEFFKYYIF